MEANKFSCKAFLVHYALGLTTDRFFAINYNKTDTAGKNATEKSFFLYFREKNDTLGNCPYP